MASKVMRVLAVTHAHLTAEGLSPVSCERADSFVGVWGELLHWDIDVIHTKNTRWAGIWPGGKGLKINIIEATPPPKLMMGPEELFSETFKTLLRKKKFAGVATLLTKRVSKRIRALLAGKGLAFPAEISRAQKWGRYLLHQKNIRDKQYDFIFACVGHGDEYLLQTALTLSRDLHVPMVVDFRDLWSDHHEIERFTEKQRALIRKYEMRLLRNTKLLSVPQKPLAEKFREYLSIPVHVAPHSAHIDKNWPDGHVVSDEFRMLYAGKIYAHSPALMLLLQMIQKLSQEDFGRPIKCHFYIDDADALKKLMAGMDIENNVVIHGWVSPADIWKEMRSAHLLLLFGSKLYKNMPLIMTKAYQYAHTGRPILAISNYDNATYRDFFDTYKAGALCQTVDEAVQWVKNLIPEEQQYQIMPNFRTVPTRTEIALEYGRFIEDLFKAE